METAAFVVLAVIIVLLGLMLWAKLKPDSRVGKDVLAVEKGAGTTWADAVAQYEAGKPVMARWGQTFITDAEALAAGFKRIEPALQTELQSILTAAEKRLMDMSSEDAKIAQAQADTADANSAKALKLQLVREHVETLQAHIAAHTPNAGS